MLLSCLAAVALPATVLGHGHIVMPPARNNGTLETAGDCHNCLLPPAARPPLSPPPPVGLVAVLGMLHVGGGALTTISAAVSDPRVNFNSLSHTHMTLRPFVVPPPAAPNGSGWRY